MLRRINLIVSTLFISSLFYSGEILSQCTNNNTFLTNLTPAYAGDTVFNNCIKGGEYITTNVELGTIYVFSTCGQTGFNTQMTLRNANGSVWYAYNDNFCGQQSKITWTASYTGSVRLLIDESPSCGHNTTCQQIMVTQQCQANAGTTSLLKNGNSISSPVYLCESKDTLEIISNNNYTLPPADSGEVAELMYMVFKCPPTKSNPLLDTCFTGLYLKNKNVSIINPGVLNTGETYYILPVTVDDGDNGGNPNNQVNLDNNGDSCYDVGSYIKVSLLNPIAFASNLDCDNKSVDVTIFGGKPEFDASYYTIVNTGSGTITGLPASHKDTISITGLNNGDFYSFSLVDDNGCQTNFSGGPFSVPNAGLDTSFRVCNSSAAFNLSQKINGVHDSTGKWYNPAGILKNGVFTPGISLDGIWKYIVNGYSVCSNDTSFMEITTDSIMEAGNNSSSTICQYDSIQNLWLKLSPGSDTGGTWFKSNNTTFNGIINYKKTFQPNLTYKYVVNIQSGCARDSSYHQILMKKFPIAGNNTSITICSNQSSFSMTSKLTGGPNLTGSWFSPNNSPHSVNFNPAVDLPGAYKYIVYGQPPCPDTSALLSIAVSKSSNAGIGSTISICRSNPTINLISYLSGNPDTNGYWTNPNGDTVLLGLVQPSSAISGNYKYTVKGITPCPIDSTNLFINFISIPNPGLNANLSFCSNSNTVDLYTLLPGNPDSTGIWKDPNSTIISGLFNPANDPVGIYTYIVSGTFPCADSSAHLIINITTAPDPGRDTTIKFCINNDSINVFNLLDGNPDSGGLWYNPSNNLFQMPFDPGIDQSGTYKYKVTGLMPCADSSSEINLVVESPSDPGSNGTALLCSTDSLVNLFNYLTGTPDSSGVWRDSMGISFSGVFVPSINLPGIYKYTTTSNIPCQDTSAFVNVIVFSALNPGYNGILNICSSDSSQTLISQLTGNPNTIGTWKNPFGNYHSGILQPGIDSSGIYKYELNGIGTCSDTSSMVNVIIDKAPNPGKGDTLVFCTNDSAVNLFLKLEVGADQNGTWYNPLSTIISNGIYNPSTDTTGFYYYKVTTSGPCKDSNAFFLLNTNPFANAGLNGSIDKCESDSAFNLFTVLNGNPQITGFWKNSVGNFISGSFNPFTDSSDVFSYTVAGKSPCSDSTAYAVVNVIQNVNPGKDTSLYFCDNMTPLNLFNSIPGNPDPGGTWYKPTLKSFSGILDPAVDSNGIYTYNIKGQAPCLDKMAIVQVTINNLFISGLDASLSICENDPPFNFFNLLNGKPDIYGVWTDPNDSVFDGISSNIELISGKYKYKTSNVAPCPEDSAYVDLTIKTAPNAGVGYSEILCEVAQPLELKSKMTGDPDSNGVWLDPLSNNYGGIFDPSSHLSGTYLYVVNGQLPCTDDTAFVDLEIMKASNAGSDQLIDICWNSEIHLTQKLNSSSERGGIWLNSAKIPINGLFNGEKDIPGIYYYVIPANSYCPSDSMKATISLIEEFNIYAGPDVNIVIGQKKPLKASSYYALTYEWQPSTGLSDNLISNPMVFTEITTEYVIQGKDQHECINSDTLLVTVLPKLFIPNSFTPNQDGLNDEWYIEGLYEYPGAVVRIFNLDNYEVFSSNNPYERWNGKKNGQNLPQGNYIYFVEFSDDVNAETISGKISLLR